MTTTLQTAAQQALEALERCAIRLPDPEAQDGVLAAQQRHQRIEFVVASAIDALRAALAEPHVWVCPEAADTHRYDKPGHCEDCGKTLIQMAEPVAELREQNTMLDAKLGELEAVAEPVAWQWLNTGHFRKKLPRTAELGNWQPLYAAPPQRKPLTDAQLRAMFEIGEK